MDERFACDARDLMRDAKDVARARGHRFVDTAHVLLALLARDACAAVALLGELGATPADVRAAVDERLRPGEAGGTSGDLPLAPSIVGVLEGSATAMRERGEERIGTEHVLLALAAAGRRSIAARALEVYGVTAERVRAALDR